MRDYVNDFFTVNVPATNFFFGTSPNTNVDIDINDFNSIIIINTSNNRTIRVPFPSGKNLFPNQRIEIIGRENELCKGKLTITFLKSVNTGQALIIRKKFIK